jgi:PAS domain S-box-containing protein
MTPFFSFFSKMGSRPKKEAYRMRAPKALLVENSSDVISLVNAQGKVLYASAPSAKVFGYLPEELVGRNTFDLIHPEDRDHSRRALREVLAKPPGPRQVEVHVRRKDGGWCCVESTISNLLDEPRIGAIVVNCREISARKAAVEVRNNAQFQDFAYAIAHDFREALGTISMFTELLVRKTELDASGKELAHVIVAGVARMSALFEGLHGFAVRGSDDPPESLDLRRVVAEVLQNLAAAITASGAIVTVDPLPLVQGNQEHLLRVFQNLIANAIKYRSEAPVEIRVTAERLGPDWMIKVKDNGIGIAPEHHERIFRLLQRLHGPETPGAGIGLAICKKIIEAAGGSIWVESQAGSGSIFCFTIPAAQARGVEASSTRDIAPGAGSRRAAGGR